MISVARKPSSRQRVDLVLHEGDQRRDDEHGPPQDARRELVGQRLARAGRHDADAVAAREHGLDDLALPWRNASKPKTSRSTPWMFWDYVRKTFYPKPQGETELS